MATEKSDIRLRRTLSLPLLVFYGVGVTVGAGIFALIGEVLFEAGDHAPLAFLVAGLVAGATGLSYARLAAVYPRAGGEAIYARKGLGSAAAVFTGYGVTATGIISSAVIALAFGNYLGTLVPIPVDLLVAGIVGLLAAIACLGVKESVVFAAVITLMEVGTLLLLSFFGLPLLAEPENLNRVLTLPADLKTWSMVVSTALLAFFAFIGFEDIVNMAEETRNAERNIPCAVIITLFITIFIYVMIASIAVSIAERDLIAGNAAPMAAMFSLLTGMNGEVISIMASVAMVNGILVQIVMASRVMYGLTQENLAPALLGRLNPKRQTPINAIVLIGGLIIILALVVPLGTLARWTSLVILTVFTVVNLSLWRIGSNERADTALRKWRYWGLFSAVLCLLLLITSV